MKLRYILVAAGFGVAAYAAGYLTCARNSNAWPFREDPKAPFHGRAWQMDGGFGRLLFRAREELDLDRPGEGPIVWKNYEGTASQGESALYFQAFRFPRQTSESRRQFMNQLVSEFRNQLLDSGAKLTARWPRGQPFEASRDGVDGGWLFTHIQNYEFNDGLIGSVHLAVFGDDSDTVTVVIAIGQPQYPVY